MRKLRLVVSRLRGQNRSAATVRAYQSDWEDFAGWCRGAGRECLPASEETIVLYLADRLAQMKLSTLGRRVAAIASVHKQGQHNSPIGAEVRGFLSGAKRERGNDTESKAAMTVEDLRCILRVLPRTAGGVRNRAMLLMGFSLGVRRVELVALDFEDLSFSRHGVAVHIRKSKTDQNGDGRVIGLFKGKRESTCPVEALRRWLYLRGRKPGPLFVRCDAAGDICPGERISTMGWYQNLRDAIELAGLDASRLAPHSLRAGMITAAIEGHVPESVIMQRSGHKSIEVFMRYFRPASVFRTNPLAKAL